MKCDVGACSNLGLWNPVVVVMWKPRFKIQPIRGVFSIVLCDKCKGEFTMNGLFKSGAWESIRKELVQKRYPPPKLSFCKLEFQAIPDVTEVRRLHLS